MWWFFCAGTKRPVDERELFSWWGNLADALASHFKIMFYFSNLQLQKELYNVKQ